MLRCCLRVHLADIHLADVHSVDVRSVDVHLVDVHSVDVHLVDVHLVVTISHFDHSILPFLHLPKATTEL